MNQLTWAVLFVTFMTKLWVTTQGIYVDNGNPYDNGTLEVVNLTLSQHDAPLLTKVYYPKKIDTYAVVFFAGGLLGWIPAESYSDVLKRVASHGFVVIGVDYLPYTFPTPPPEVRVRTHTQEGVQSHQSKKYLEELQWLAQHLEARIAQQLNQTGLVPDFRHLAVSCHSAGCDPIVDMAMENQTFSKAALFLEPFSYHFKTPMTYTMPAFILGTEFSTEHPACIFPREGYDHFYDMWQCPKIVMNVKGHGHCEVLDAWLYSVCAKYQFCKANPDADINKYHNFIQGISAAFLTTTLQGWDKLQYITNTTLLPVQLLEFKKDLDC
ncbi:PREDICTED: chlorophyllase-1-like [Branchiostoma belcheri]|uniref:Chlorophyllase-1-like n=1 Tax=Branchiostoma belcheri TaxID=7741 RepID=A0A6P5A6F6_BRABE|nr:PREDICTED: chlorophyllase-1-like [Branchiostoma belcheri]